MWDLPTSQQQQPAVLQLDAFTHLMAAGAPQSGRSQLLRTIAAALALAHSAADVHLYGIDCGNGALLPLTELPHCGAVVSRTQTEWATRLLKRLAAELSRRQELLAADGFASSGLLLPGQSACRTCSSCWTAGKDSPAPWENSKPAA
jgi:S-DNA-T family DNA segregation ATPase FtsK/SpoIIIE